MDQRPTLSISLTAKDAAAAFDFYVNGMGAKELTKMTTPDGNVGHSELQIGDTAFYLSCESSDWQAVGLGENETAPCSIIMESQDCDADFNRAIEAGATVIFPPSDSEGVGRMALIRDPFGYRWALIKRT